jgi:hypothetical protein
MDDFDRRPLFTEILCYKTTVAMLWHLLATSEAYPLQGRSRERFSSTFLAAIRDKKSLS